MQPRASQRSCPAAGPGGLVTFITVQQKYKIPHHKFYGAETIRPETLPFT